MYVYVHTVEIKYTVLMLMCLAHVHARKLIHLAAEISTCMCTSVEAEFFNAIHSPLSTFK